MIKLPEKYRKYHFELKHFLVGFTMLICFQLVISIVHRISLRRFVTETRSWYRQDFAERLANLTATSLELLLETTLQHQNMDEENRRVVTKAFNIILTQQLLRQNVEAVCLLMNDGDRVITMDNGQALYSHFFEQNSAVQDTVNRYQNEVALYREIQHRIQTSEQTQSVLNEEDVIHVFVPFVPKGENLGVLYLKSRPEFGFLTKEIIANFNRSNLLFTIVIFFGLWTMFLISSRTVQERNEAQRMLYTEREEKLKERIHFQKEALFAKRIYHTHHKAEKVMGFIKQDLESLSDKNIKEIKYRITKYASFISRVIYDMKWFDPPLQTIRNPYFRTDLNEVIRFMINHLFMRVASKVNNYQFDLDLDDSLPPLPVNEYVIWEIIEPLIQNAIDHANVEKIVIHIETRHQHEKSKSILIIEDNGEGVDPELLEMSRGIRRMFLDNVSTKSDNGNSGYGCYIAYEIATQRCGWKVDAENIENGGCRVTLTMHHS